MNFANKFKTLLGYVPRGLRHEIYRRTLTLNYQWPDELRLKLATTQTELEAAFQLSGRVRVQHLMPQSSVLIALWNDEVVGTVTLVRENPMGLSIQKLLGGRPLCLKQGRLAELTCMAFDPRFRNGLNRVFFPLLKFAYHYAHDYFGVTGIVAAVKPSTVDMYQAILGARQVSHAPTGVVFVDLEHYLDDLDKLYRAHSITSDLSRYFASHVERRWFSLPDREFMHVSDSIISPRVMNDLFLEKLGLRAQLTDEEKEILVQQYPHENYRRVLGVDKPCQRTAWRTETRLPARIGLSRGLSEVWDVSTNGLRLSTTETLEVGRRIVLRINLNRSVQAHINAEVRWVSPGRIYGLKIESANAAWTQMTKALEARFDKLASGASSALDSQILA